MKKIFKGLFIAVLLTASTVISAKDVYTNFATGEQQTRQIEQRYRLADALDNNVSLATEGSGEEGYTEDDIDDVEIDDSSMYESEDDYDIYESDGCDFDDYYEYYDDEIMDYEYDSDNSYDDDQEYYDSDFEDYDYDDDTYEYDYDDDFDGIEYEDFGNYIDDEDYDYEDEDDCDDYTYDYADEDDFAFDYADDDNDEDYEYGNVEEDNNDDLEDYDCDNVEEEDYVDEDKFDDDSDKVDKSDSEVANEEEDECDDCHEGIQEEESEPYEVHFIKNVNGLDIDIIGFGKKGEDIEVERSKNETYFYDLKGEYLGMSYVTYCPVVAMHNEKGYYAFSVSVNPTAEGMSNADLSGVEVAIYKNGMLYKTLDTENDKEYLNRYSTGVWAWEFAIDNGKITFVR